MIKVFFVFNLLLINFSYGAPKLKGDFRYRLERLDQDGNPDRVRHRIRGRIGAYGVAQDKLRYGVRLATGSDDPISTNQTLGSGASSKDINIDLFYLKYSPRKSMRLFAGKFKNKFFRPSKTELIWDNDLSPEGLHLKWKCPSLFVNIAYLIMEERSAAPDTVLQGLQVGYIKGLGPIKLTIGGSYYDYLAIQGNTPLYDTSDSFGNTLAGGNYKNDYNLMEGFLVLTLKKYPLSFFINFVKNDKATEKDTGMLFGVKTGKKLKVLYNYRNIKSDAVVGAFTDSDFKGGGSDGKGHELQISYPFGKKLKMSVSHFFNDTAIDNGKTYHRTFIDFGFDFS